MVLRVRAGLCAGGLGSRTQQGRRWSTPQEVIRCATALDGKGMAKGTLDGVGSKLTPTRFAVDHASRRMTAKANATQSGDEGLPEPSKDDLDALWRFRFKEK